MSHYTARVSPTYDLKDPVHLQVSDEHGTMIASESIVIPDGPTVTAFEFALTGNRIREQLAQMGWRMIYHTPWHEVPEFWWACVKPTT